MKVVCIDNGGIEAYLKIGKVYTVLQEISGLYRIFVKGNTHEYNPGRFRAATPLDIVKARLK